MILFSLYRVHSVFSVITKIFINVIQYIQCTDSCFSEFALGLKEEQSVKSHRLPD